MKGRRHTSTMAIAVLPVDKTVGSSYRDSDFKVERVCGSGPGGQHRNKNATAVRITHKESGISAYSAMKSQHHNYEVAMTVVLARLSDKQNAKVVARQNQDRSEQLGTKGRGTKVRTYNFIENRTKDERVSKNFRTSDIMSG